MKLLDTTFLIDVLRDGENVRQKAEELKNEALFTTRINIFEILVGIFSLSSGRERRLHQASMLFERVAVLELDEKGATLAAQISGELNREGRPVEPGDCLIAGIALSNGIRTIVTRNTKRFIKMKGLHVESY